MKRILKPAQPEHTNQAKQRLAVISLGVIVVFSLLLWRLVDVQLVRGTQFWQAAEQNRWFELPVIPARGVILDRFGMPIVENHRSYLLLDSPDQLYSKGTLISQEEALPILATDSARIRKISKRYYPFKEALAHVVGYVGLITQEDTESDKTLRPFGVIGKTGLELAFEQQLRGQLGKDRFEVDARVRRQREFSVTPAVAGADLHTTLDPILSTIAYEALGEQKGVVMISDVSTGHILSLVNKPSYDPNLFSDLDPLLDETTRRIAVSKIQNWFEDAAQPFFNRAVSGQYPPGSIFKIVTALAGLETEVITPSTTVLDEGVLKVGDFSYANWYWTQFGRTEGEVNLVKALARSNDIYFYKVAEWIGPNRLAELSRLFGLGKLVGIEISGEKAGLIPDSSWKLSVVGEPWYLGNTYHFGIGQGDVKTTPLQLLQLIQTFGNKGTMCPPRLVESDDTSCQELGVKESSIQTVLLGMLDACSPGGTSFPFFARNGIAFEGLNPTDVASIEPAIERGAVACKTGTAEFGGKDYRGFRNTHALWGGIVEPDIALDVEDEAIDVNADSQDSDLRKQWLARIKQLKKEGKSYPKRIAIVVIVESDAAQPFKEGSREAAPVAAKILDWMEGK